MPRILTPQRSLNKVAEPKSDVGTATAMGFQARTARVHRLVLLAIGACLATALPAGGHVDLERFRAPASGAPAPSNLAGDCAVGVYCRAHGRFLVSDGSRVRGDAPAARALVSGILGLLLYGPGERFTVRVFARGAALDSGATLSGDLCLEGIHPALIDGSELWQIVRLVLRAGLKRIDGRVVWQGTSQLRESTGATRFGTLDEWRKLGRPTDMAVRLPELEERLRLAGVQVAGVQARSEPPSAALPAESRTTEARLIGSWESGPLVPLLRRDMGILQLLLVPPESTPDRLGETLQSVDARGIDWIPAEYPAMSLEESLRLLDLGLQHQQVGPDLTAALPELSLGKRLRWVHAVFQREGDVTEILGTAELPKHGPVLVGIRGPSPKGIEELGDILDASLRAAVDEDGRLLALQELPNLRYSLGNGRGRQRFDVASMTDEGAHGR